jgi:hypothetical protein
MVFEIPHFFLLLKTKIHVCIIGLEQNRYFKLFSSMVPLHRFFLQFISFTLGRPEFFHQVTQMKAVHECSILVDTEINVLNLIDIFLSYAYKDSQCTAKSMYKGEILAPYLLLIHIGMQRIFKTSVCHLRNCLKLFGEMLPIFREMLLVRRPRKD